MAGRFVALTFSLTALGGTLIAATTAATHVTYRAAIYAVRDDGTERHLIALPEPAVPYLVRSPGGQSILFTREVDGVRALFAATRSGTNAIRLTPPDLPVKEYPLGAFSPDGRLIAFTTSVDCGWRCFRSSLYIVRRDGSELRLVAGNAGSPSWAPDSHRLAYGGSRGTYGPAHGVYVTDSEANETTRVAQGSVDWPLWAPRGERVAYWANHGYGVACFVNADGSRRRCTHGHSLTSFVWSRDGKRLAFKQATPRGLGFVGSDARRVHYLGYHGRTATPAAWSPDGRRLAFQVGSSVYVVRRDAPGRSIRVIDEPTGSSLSDLRWRGQNISFVLSAPYFP